MFYTLKLAMDSCFGLFRPHKHGITSIFKRKGSKSPNAVWSVISIAMRYNATRNPLKRGRQNPRCRRGFWHPSYPLAMFLIASKQAQVPNLKNIRCNESSMLARSVMLLRPKKACCCPWLLGIRLTIF